MSRQSHAAAMTGVSDELRNAVDGDLVAAARGPLTLDRVLGPVPDRTIRARYRALLALTTYPDLKPAAAELLDRAEAADEVTQTRRGGNR